LFHNRGTPVYAFLAYGNSDQADLTPQRRQAASALLAELKQTIRAERNTVGER
jgi:hypothetical protein